MIMKKSLEFSGKLSDLINSAYAELADITEIDLSLDKTKERKWNKKEILGHLIDSACNNHQRFIRTQLSSELAFPAYNQQDWVKVQDYANARWKDLLELWKYYNLHLVSFISQIPKNALDRKMIIGANEPISLQDLINEYISHLEHHIDQMKISFDNRRQ